MSDAKVRRNWWHRLLGIMLDYYFSRRGFRVDMDIDVAIKEQRIDYIVVQQKENPKLGGICDGFDNLGSFNLITYKSQHESFNRFAMDELIGYYIAYYKKLNIKYLRPKDIRLYVLTTRHPRQVLNRFDHREIQKGVFSVKTYSNEARIIVLRDTPVDERNAILAMFSGAEDKFLAGARFYHPKPSCRSVLDQLYLAYKFEDLKMDYTIQDFIREVTLTGLKDLSLDERLQGLAPEDRIKGLDLEVRLKGLGPEERLKGLGPEERLKGLGPEERLKLLALLSEDLSEQIQKQVNPKRRGKKK